MHDPDLIFPFPFTGVGSDFAQYISSHDTLTNKPYVNRSHKLLEQSMICLRGYIILSYIYLGEENIESSTDDGGGEKFWVAATPRNQLVVSSMFAVLGAYIGHLLVDMISEKLRHPLIPMETLICNGMFGLLGLTLNMMKLIDVSWGDSLLLRGFALNFCGAASLFARHASDNRRLYTKKGGGRRQAMVNVTANIIFATIVFWVAFEIEEWEQPHDTRRGVVVKIQKILERRRLTKQHDEE